MILWFYFKRITSPAVHHRIKLSKTEKNKYITVLLKIYTRKKHGYT